MNGAGQRAVRFIILALRRKSVISVEEHVVSPGQHSTVGGHHSALVWHRRF